MDLALTHEQILLQESTAKFTAEQLSLSAKTREEAHQIPHALITTMAHMGLMGVNIPSIYGGCEAGPLSYVIALKEIASGDASVAVTMSVTNMVAEVINHFGNTAQKQSYIPKITSGEFFAGAFGLSEASAGSDPGGMTTHATQYEQNGSIGWLLNGEKMWITSGDEAGVIIVWARTSQETKGNKGIGCFLVPKGTLGLSYGKPEPKMGLRASHTVSLAFSDMWLPKEALLGPQGEGFSIAMMALDGGRIGIAAQSVGIATQALQESIRYVKERKQFGKPIASFQALQFMLSDMATEIDAAWLLTMRAASLKEQGVPFSQEAAMAKMYASEMANRTVRAAVQIQGGYGYSEESVVARLFRDCRVTQIYEGTSEIQRIVIARNLLRE